MTQLTPTRIAEYAYKAGFRGQALTIAVAVALAESNGRTDAKGDTTLTNGTWGPSIGLWQIRSLWTDKGTGHQRDQEANLHPDVNARHAYQISSHGTNWQPWSTYTNGAYRSHLTAARTAAHHATKTHGGHPAGTAPSAGGHRIVLDEAELSKLHAFFEHATARIRHVRRGLTDVSTDIEPARAALTDPALAALISKTFAYLESPEALPKSEERMDWHATFAARVRALVAKADGPDTTWSTAETARFTSTHKHPKDLATRLILDAIHAHNVHRPHTATHHHLPVVHTAGLTNGHVPASRLTPVGYHERLLTPVARQYLRMAAAARTAGISLPLNDGYRSYAEQAVLYQRYRNGTGNLAAAPGHSNHGFGLSVDISTTNPRVVPWLRAHAATYGFHNDVPTEPWHWTYQHS